MPRALGKQKRPTPLGGKQKCPVCNGWLLKANQFTCIVCYIAERNRKKREALAAEKEGSK